jgi:lipoprotein-releasing system permease protein
LLLIIAIAAFNVVSTLVMVVVEKQGSIAILRTMGASSSDIVSVFIYHGMFIGLIGTGLGVLVGCCLAHYLPALVSGLEGLVGFQFLKSDVYPISYVPSDLRVIDVIWVSVVSVSMSFLSTLYPAWRASQVQPAKVLRYE